MKPNVENVETTAIRSIAEMLRACSAPSLDQGDLTLLKTEREALTEEDMARLNKIFNQTCRGFLHLAAVGHAFLPEARIKERFGMTLAETSPQASASFLRFATTYWTLRLLVWDMAGIGANKGYSSILRSLEAEIGAIFFPTPGPTQINIGRRDIMKYRIEEASAPIDIEDFLGGNPVLQNLSRPGCGGIIAVILFTIVRASRDHPFA